MKGKGRRMEGVTKSAPLVNCLFREKRRGSVAAGEEGI